VDRHGNHSPTFYCGKACQQKDWRAKHKRKCKAANDRKALYRAAAILQPVFKAVCRLTWFANVLGVAWAGEDEERKLVVRFGEMTKGADFKKFPEDMLPDEQAREVLLAAEAGLLSMVTMSTTLRMLLQGKRLQEICICSWLINLGTCDEARIKENAVEIDGRVVTSLLPGDDEDEDKDKDDDKSSECEKPLHWFFKIELANGEFYVLDLCTAQFTSTPGEEAWACVSPLDEHLRRLPLTERLPGWSGMAQDLGCQRQRLLNEIPMQSTPENIMAGVFELEDLGCEAQKFAPVRLEEIISRWEVAQSMSPGETLHLPEARFMHTFCTFVWPIELMGRELRPYMVLLMATQLRKRALQATSGPGDNG
jgi:hypothetical protein